MHVPFLDSVHLRELVPRLNQSISNRNRDMLHRDMPRRGIRDNAHGAQKLRLWLGSALLQARIHDPLYWGISQIITRGGPLFGNSSTTRARRPLGESAMLRSRALPLGIRNSSVPVRVFHMIKRPSAGSRLFENLLANASLPFSENTPYQGSGSLPKRRNSFPVGRSQTKNS